MLRRTSKSTGSHRTSFFWVAGALSRTPSEQVRIRDVEYELHAELDSNQIKRLTTVPVKRDFRWRGIVVRGSKHPFMVKFFDGSGMPLSSKPIHSDNLCGNPFPVWPEVLIQQGQAITVELTNPFESPNEILMSLLGVHRYIEGLDG